MKHSALLAVATALLVAFTVGCKSPGPKTTPLPTAGGPSDANATGATGRRTPDLNTSPTGPGSGVTSGAGVTGASVPNVPTDLPDDAKLEGRDQDRTMFASETIHFDFDRANVRASDVSKVQKVAERFKALPPGHDLLIEGHCDERGTEGYNQALGERRALAARELLTSSGINSQNAFTKSLGKDNPADPGHTETAWSKNRRAEFILVLPKKITTTQNP